MTDDRFTDEIEFDDGTLLALASLGSAGAPGAAVRERLLTRLADAPQVPAGFEFRWASDGDWLPHPVPGIRMKVLARNQPAGYLALLLDVAPGTRFPPHHHAGAEECYVVTGSLYTCGRRMVAGDFLHADARTEHGELWTDEGCRVVLIVSSDDAPAEMKP